jgi:large subunit ribosomal protein L21
MSYAIISVGGKQYRVSAGERLLVDRLPLEDGATFNPTVLLTGGDGEPQIAPAGALVTAKVLRQAKGPKIRIGKYKQRTGYKRHTGFRASLTQIEIESIGGKAKQEKTKAEKPKATEPAGVPAGYADLTVAELKSAAGGWNATELEAALAYERAHAKRKGAIAALESAISEGGED